MGSIYIEMVILATCFGVTLAAIWRSHLAVEREQATRQALNQIIADLRMDESHG